MQHRARRNAWGWAWAGLVVLILIGAVAASLGMYAIGKRHAGTAYTFGDLDARDRVLVNAWIGRFDPASNDVTIEVSAGPEGALADAAGDFAAEVVLTPLTALKSDPLTVEAGQRMTATELHFPIDGVITDYPFDRHRLRLAFEVTGADRHPLPLAVTVANGDAFFRTTNTIDATETGAVDLTVQARRSTPTLVFAVFVMVLMFGLALAAATAAYYVLRWRRGLLFPACSLMAVVLFALVPLRNAVPGNPPIGSIIDFASFFLAEGIISVALIASVVIGYRIEIARERIDAQV
ncbi:DUF4436 domain-containing protein [Nocardia sp. CDC159]|uniref:DUF4436 domain-containing protein n=1 Tax=Nocardia pulmonis TaxID=2951408 RepID=A0A9X2E5I4_9NOCA|nr:MULTISPECIES: DUF4436 family protein [Nocardia]MCM6773463.1 DUF4436 domain-containing protein [Nocardia pulmonis]MCM6786350.1 DUF4436 domain-containing protein [Nocardia sp. CDC159]